MKLLDSWQRTSWLTTKVCHMRRAMETGSNWTRRLWLLRASQAAANTQSIHISLPLAPIQPVASALYCSLGEEYIFWGCFYFFCVFKAPGTSLFTDAHLTSVSVVFTQIHFIQICLNRSPSCIYTTLSGSSVLSSCQGAFHHHQQTSPHSLTPCCSDSL